MIHFQKLLDNFFELPIDITDIIGKYILDIKKKKLKKIFLN